jgi:drug/metabolite transporter (DMT)-like permease
VRILYSLLLVGVTMVWGWTFVVVQDAIALYSVLGFLTVRFALAAVALASYGARKISLRTLGVGAGIGLALALGHLFQTTSLLFTSPTNSGLITGLFVIFAPLADRLSFGVRSSRLLSRRRPPRRSPGLRGYPDTLGSPRLCGVAGYHESK